MKRTLIALLALITASCLADGNWRETLGKVRDLTGDTGIAGFARKDAPAYITGD